MLYPQQNDRRNLLDLSGIWDFQIDPDEAGEAEGWYNGLNDQNLILEGAIPAAVLAVAVELLFEWLERGLIPAHLRD